MREREQAKSTEASWSSDEDRERDDWENWGGGRVAGGRGGGGGMEEKGGQSRWCRRSGRLIGTRERERERE